MPISFTSKGYLEVWRDGQRISQHRQEREALERITEHHELAGDGEYEIRSPLVVAKAYGVLSPGESDTTAPSVPGSLAATALSATQIQITWTQSTDNIGVAGYQVFRNGSPLQSTTELTFTDTSLTPSTQYSYEVSAFDAAGNNSANAGPALATTDANSAPVWSLGNQSYDNGQSVSITLDSFCADADGDTINYSLSSGTLPTGLSLSGARNQTLSGTVSADGSFAFVLAASDGIAADQTVSLTFTVTTADVTAPDAPSAPTVSTFGSSTITLSLPVSAAGDHASYTVQRSTDGTNFGNRVTGITASTWQDTGLNAETSYHYRLLDVDTSGNVSDPGTSVSQTTTDSSGINTALTVEYVDTSGVRQSTAVVDGSTTITGIAPFLVQFDGSGTRAVNAYAAQSAITDEEAYNWLMVGYRMNFGESLGTNWAYPESGPLSGISKDEETGPPLFSRVFTTTGAHTVRLRARDTAGNESTISMTVNVNAAGAATHIPTSNGSWPTFFNSTRYTLDAGADYTSFGTMSFAANHNIIIEKVGVGADPIVSEIQPESRDAITATETTEYRSAHLRFVNLDIQTFNERNRGMDYCGVIGGAVRAFSIGQQSPFWHEGTAIRSSNVRYSRGIFFQNMELNNEGANPPGYLVFGPSRSFHFRDVLFNYTNAWDENSHGMIRIYGAHHTWRHCKWRSSQASQTNAQVTQSTIAVNGAVETAWRDDDIVGDVNSSDNSDTYGYLSDKLITQNCQFYDDTSSLMNGVSATGADQSGIYPGFPRLMGWEDCVWYPVDTITRQGIDTCSLQGEYNYWRNCKKNMGVGSDIGFVTADPNAGNAGYEGTHDGPYFGETTNTRPVPSAF